MNTGKIFQRRKEDFDCERCHFFVRGNGYTNHCPKCLYSKHVDIFPGDREELCGGLMEPVALEREKGEERIVQRCILCGYMKKNKVGPLDDFEALLEVTRKMVKK